MFEPEELQVMIYGGDGTRRIVRGTYEKVQLVVQAIGAVVPSPQAFTMQDTELGVSASLSDTRTPATPAAYNTSYPNREYNEL